MDKEENKIVIDQKESIKLTKTTKSYTWEIKTLDMDLDRLQKIDEELRERFVKGGFEEDD